MALQTESGSQQDIKTELQFTILCAATLKNGLGGAGEKRPALPDTLRNAFEVLFSFYRLFFVFKLYSPRATLLNVITLTERTIF